MIFCIGFLFGVFVSSLYPISIFVSIVFVISLVSLFVVFSSLNFNKTKLISLFFLALFLGFLRIGIFNYYSVPDKPLQQLVNQNISGKALITDEPDRRDTTIRLTAKVKSIKGEGGQINIKNGGVIFVTDLNSIISYGDEVSFSGKLLPIEDFQTDSDRIFHYQKFMERSGIYYDLYNPKLTVISRDNGFYLRAWLFNLKENFLKQLSSVIPRPEVLLLGGLLLGTKHSLGNDLLADFQKTGVIHMVVISGYNITVVVEAMSAVFSFLPFLARIFSSSVGVILFVLMTGFSSASLRAGIMVLIALLGKAVSRKYDVVRAIVISAFILTILSPLVIVYDPSFQLSFLASLALIFVSPIIENYFKFVPEFLKLQETVIATISVMIFVLPLLIYMNGVVSFLSIFVNILVLFPVPYVMFLGFITGVISFVFPFLAIPTGFISYLILHYIIFVVETAAHLKWAAATVPAFPAWNLLVVYIFYAFILWKFHRGKVTILPEKPTLQTSYQLTPNLNYQKQPQHISSCQLEHNQKDKNAPTYPMQK